MKELDRRLRSRASDAESEIDKRMGAALAEISHWSEFDHVIVNAELDRAVREAQSILVAARLKTKRQHGLADLMKEYEANKPG